MRIDQHLCDGCLLVHQPEDLGKYSNGKGSFVDLCESCVKKAVMRALKREVFIPRFECYRCHSKGVIQSAHGVWWACPTCCQ